MVWHDEERLRELLFLVARGFDGSHQVLRAVFALVEMGQIERQSSRIMMGFFSECTSCKMVFCPSDCDGKWGRDAL